MARNNVRVNHAFGVWNLLPLAFWVIRRVCAVLYWGIRVAFRLIGDCATWVLDRRQERKEVLEWRARKQAIDEEGDAAVTVTAPILEVVPAVPTPAAKASVKVAPTHAASVVSPAPVVRSGRSVRIADRHLTQKIGKLIYRFSMYQKAGEVARVEVKAGAKTVLKPYLREMALEEGVVFSIEAAIRFTEREVAEAKVSEPKPRRAAQPQTPEKAAPASTSADVPAQSAAFDPPMGDEAPVWMDVPSFEEMESQSRSSSPVAATRPAAPPATPSRAVPSRTAPAAVARSPADAVAGQGTREKEMPVDWRGAKRFTGKIMTLGYVECHPDGEDPYDIFSLTLRSDTGESKDFRGVELADLATKYALKSGDVISLKRGRQDVVVTGGRVQKKRTRNVYDFQLQKRGPEVSRRGRR